MKLIERIFYKLNLVPILNFFFVKKMCFGLRNGYVLFTIWIFYGKGLYNNNFTKKKSYFIQMFQNFEYLIPTLKK